VSARLWLAAALIATVATPLLASDADARRRDRDRYHGHHHGGWQNDWENRRDARRAGIIVGATTSAVAGAAASNRADQRYQECLYASGYYDYDCERRRHYDEQQARRNARRAGVTAGIITREIVRN
jgi:Ni/Co efflux regulator RcnB